MTEVMLRLKDVTMRFGGVVAVNELALEVHEARSSR